MGDVGGGPVIRRRQVPSTERYVAICRRIVRIRKRQLAIAERYLDEATAELLQAQELKTKADRREARVTAALRIANGKPAAKARRAARRVR